MKVFLVLLLVGLMLGVGHPVYTLYFSGSKVAELPFISRDTSNIAIGGFSMSSSKDADSVDEQVIELSPEMNPVRILAGASYSMRRNSISSTRKSNFEIDFYQKDKLLWSKPFSISESSSDDNKGIKNVNTSQALKLVDITDTAEYTLKLRTLTPQEINISELNIKVRRNVKVSNPKVYTTGGVLFVIGLIGVIISTRNAKKIEQEKPNE